MATLLLSLGVPMLLAGDEFGHTQHGNNNAYCQDNEISWLDWENIRPEDAALARLRALPDPFPAAHRVFSRPRFFRGEMLSEAGLKDITWVTPAGIEATGEDWGNPVAPVARLRAVRRGRRVLHAGRPARHRRELSGDDERLSRRSRFPFPEAADAAVWEALVDTAEPTGRAEPRRIWKPGEAYLLRAHSFALFINRAPAIAGATRHSFRLRGRVRRRWRRVPRTEAAASEEDGDAAAPSAAVRRRDRPQGIGPQGCASGYGRRARQTWRWCWTGARRNRSRCEQEPDGWWSVTTDRAAAGSRYRYRVDGGDYPDPASRYQPDGVHGASEVIDPGAYRWSDTGWRGRPWEEMVIYELHLGTFSESGDFAGAISRLDDLVELGVTAIELMPIARVSGAAQLGL